MVVLFGFCPHFFFVCFGAPSFLFVCVCYQSLGTIFFCVACGCQFIHQKNLLFIVYICFFSPGLFVRIHPHPLSNICTCCLCQMLIQLQPQLDLPGVHFPFCFFPLFFMISFCVKLVVIFFFVFFCIFFDFCFPPPLSRNRSFQWLGKQWWPLAGKLLNTLMHTKAFLSSTLDCVLCQKINGGFVYCIPRWLVVCLVACFFFFHFHCTRWRIDDPRKHLVSVFGIQTHDDDTFQKEELK